MCRLTRRSVKARAEADEKPSEPVKAPEPVAEEEPKQRGLVPGQGTAIWTGLVSVILGLAYIALVVAMDNRGEILPPPPEAFLQ